MFPNIASGSTGRKWHRGYRGAILFGSILAIECMVVSYQAGRSPPSYNNVMRNQIYITKADQTKLVAIMEGMKAADERLQRWLILLEHELDRANVVESHEIPRGTVTLHSRVHLLDLDSQESVVYKLVLPSEANSVEGSLSILAPIGIAMLGYGEGDSFDVIPGGTRRFVVESVLFQPEADFSSAPAAFRSASRQVR